jgi:Flp pilus assembly protein TadD
MTTPGEMLDMALRYHQAGELIQAEQIYRLILQVEPHHPEATHFLGVLAHQAGNHHLAVETIRQAIQFRPSYPEAHNNLGLVLQALGRVDEALSSFRQAVALQPAMTGAHLNLGNLLLDRGAVEEALAHFQEILRHEPRSATAYYSIALARRKEGKLPEAEAACRQAIECSPEYAEAHDLLGIVLMEQGRLEEAVPCYHQALRLKPTLVGTPNNLANVYRDLGRLAEAEAGYQQTLRLRPGFPEIHKNLGELWLLQGDFARGWPAYEWRWQCSIEFALPPLAQPRWDGSSLAGKTILLHTEQGLGDTIQFIRYAPLVKERAAAVLICCKRAMIPLVKTCAGIDQVYGSFGDLPSFDVYTSLMSLPGVLGTTLDAIPAQVPYLFPDRELLEQWRGTLRNYFGFKVGIGWQGSKAYRGDLLRSISLAQFAPLARIDGVRLISLQKGPGSEQIATADFELLDLGSKLDESTGAFMDTAAVMKSLDLVITSDSAIAHLAGALGVPVWVALAFAPDWRWLMQRTDSPWYPTMRLFRQTKRGNWEEVFQRIAEALRQKVA